MAGILTRSCEERRDMSIQADFPLLSLSRLPIPCRVDLNPALGRLSTSPSYDSECDDKAIHSPEDRVSEEFPPIPGSIFGSMAWPRCGTAVVAGRAAAGGRAVVRPADDRGAHRTPHAGVDSRQAVSRTLPIHSAQPDLAQFAACCRLRRGRALLSAPWIRLAPGPNRCRRRLWKAVALAELPPLRSSW